MTVISARKTIAQLHVSDNPYSAQISSQLMNPFLTSVMSILSHTICITLNTLIPLYSLMYSL